MKRTFALLMGGAAVAAFALAGCGGQQAAEGPLKIAVAQDLSGPVSEIGIAARNGAHLAADQINKQGGIGGRMLELVDFDDRCEPVEAANVANKVAIDDELLAVVGHECSSACLAADPIYTDAGIVQVSTSCTSPRLTTDAGPYTFRVIVTDAFQADVLAEWMVEEGMQQIAILYANDDFGVGLRDTGKVSLEKYGAEVIAEEAFTQGETKDFKPIITKVRALEPDAVFFAGYHAEAALFASQSADLGWDPPVYSVDVLYTPALVDLGGEAVEGFKLVAFFHPSRQDPVVQTFLTEFESQYGYPPGTYEAYGYDAVLVIAEALENVGADREAIKDFLSSLEGVQGVTGVTSFDQYGDSIKNPAKLVVENGEFRIVGE